MINREKFKALVSTDNSATLESRRKQMINRDMLRESHLIAIKVLKKLESKGWTQKDLAEKMGVSPQQISKIVSGKENLTIETQVKLQKILDIPILSSYYEQKISDTDFSDLEFFFDTIAKESFNNFMKKISDQQIISPDYFMNLKHNINKLSENQIDVMNLYLNSTNEIMLKEKEVLYNLIVKISNYNVSTLGKLSELIKSEKNTQEEII